MTDTMQPEARQIMAPLEKQERAGIAQFDGLSFEAANELIHLGAADPEDRQNDAPTFAELVAIAEVGGTGLKLHGYRVSADRDDERITAEGLIGLVDRTVQAEVLKRLGRPDVLSLCKTTDPWHGSCAQFGHLYAWWD